MALKYPDIMQHNNPDYPIADADFIAGGGRVVSDLTALYALSSKINLLKQRVTKVYVTAETKYYILKDIANVGNTNGWEIESSGGGGKSISSTSYNATTGVLTITFSDATTYSTGDLRGAAGAAGATGAAGKGITSTSYNASTGILTITFSDSSQYQTGDLRGATGTAGTNGKQIEVQKGATYIQWRYVGDSTWIDLVSLASLVGATGATGSNGYTPYIQGGYWYVNGVSTGVLAQGSTGATGSSGSNAPQVKIQYSVDGSTAWHDTYAGTDFYIHFSVDNGSTYSSAMKFKGSDGATGATGSAGSNGANALQVQIQYSVDGSTSWHTTLAGTDYYIKFSVDGGTIWSTAAKFKGNDGATGATGSPGAAGTTWYVNTGTPASGVGANGDNYLNSTNGDVYTKSGGSWGSPVGNIKGATGANQYPLVGNSASSGTITLAVNTLTALSTAQNATTFTIALASAISNFVSEYIVRFTVGAGAPTITWPSNIKWVGGVAPTLLASKTYMISFIYYDSTNIDANCLSIG